MVIPLPQVSCSVSITHPRSSFEHALESPAEMTSGAAFQGQKGELVHMWERIFSLGKGFFIW